MLLLIETKGMLYLQENFHSHSNKRSETYHGKNNLNASCHQNRLQKDTDASSLRRCYGGEIYANHNTDPYTEYWAVLQSRKGEHYGAKATLNVWGMPQVQKDQQSTGDITLGSYIDGSIENYNLVSAGWHVDPSLYGDNKTHFFVVWTANGRKGGCYNLLCPGFVLNKSSPYVPGYKIEPLSSYGEKQYYITLHISKDAKSGDWWLYYGSNGSKPVGYWPKSLFKTSFDNALIVEIGGYVCTYNGGSPPLGSGHFSSEGEGRAASFGNVQYEDKSGILYFPGPNSNFLVQPKQECYTISGSDPYYFGGPGGCTR